MLILGLVLCAVGGLLARYTINPSFPDGAYVGMTRRTWRIVGSVIAVTGVVLTILGLSTL